MDQLKQLSFLNIGVGPTEGGISFASFGNAAGGGESQGQIEDFPKSFEYFSELYSSILDNLKGLLIVFRMGSSA